MGDYIILEGDSTVLFLKLFRKPGKAYRMLIWNDLEKEFSGVGYTKFSSLTCEANEAKAMELLEEYGADNKSKRETSKTGKMDDCQMFFFCCFFKEVEENESTSWKMLQLTAI